MQNKLKFYRQLKSLTQIELANKIGISERHLQSIEYQKHEPRVQTAQKLAKALDVDITKLFPQG